MTAGDDINHVRALLPADPSQGYSAKDVVAYLLGGGSGDDAAAADDDARRVVRASEG